MSKVEAISRYNHIINKLRMKPSSFNEILDLLIRMSEIEGYNYEISKRTFKRDREDIASLYNIEIEYNASAGVFEIVYDAGREDENQRKLEAFDVFNALNVKERVSKHLYLENRKAQGTENMYGLLHAVENQLVVKFQYIKYGYKTPTSREVKPYALKEFRYRWYILAEDAGIVKSFALDRLSDLEITNNKFEVPKSFDAGKMFRDAYGIFLPNPDDPLEDIVLSFTPFQGEYVKSLPFHHSQEILEDNEQELRIKLRMYVTHDFIMDIMSYGKEVRVISPQSLIDEVSYYLREAVKLYE